jgi:ribonuclease R
MKFTVADLLDQLPAEGSIETGTLEKMLRLSNRSEKDGLKLALTGLEKIGVISLEGEGAVRRSDDHGLIEARLRCSSKGFCFAIREDGGEDIYIRDHQLNHAWNGDRVLVRITREGGRRRSPEGGVQCILERQTTSLLAHLDQQEDRMVALPLDDRLLATIELPDGAEDPSALVEVKVDRYPVAQFPARGHVARPLPLDAGPAGDRDLLLTKANLHERSDAPRASLKAPNAKKRRDLTSQPVLLLRSWSAESAPDLPAVHVKPHEGGSRLWIHSPSLAERLTPGNALDLWLREQGEAICLGEVWQPLLNKTLSEVSRFKVGEVQDAVSVRIDLSAEGEVRDWSFCLSRIQPVALVGPDALQALAARKPKARTVPVVLKPIKEQIGQLDTLLFCARSLQSDALRRGRIELDLPAPDLDSLADLRAVWPDGCRHAWLAPFNPEDPQAILALLLEAAARVWALHRQDLGLPALELSAAEPEPASLTDVAKTAVALELPLELDEDGSPAARELADAFRESPLRRVLDQQLRQALPDPLVVLAADAQTADDSAESDRPIAEQPVTGQLAPLTQPALAPWCCPTLQVVDLINQQVITSLLLDGKDRPTVRHKDKVPLGDRGVGGRIDWSLFTQSQTQKLHDLCSERLVQRLNARRRQVADLQRDVVAMMQARSCESHVGAEHPGIISGVQSYGFFVEIPPSMVEGLVHVSSLNDDWYEYRSRQNRLVGRRHRRRFQLGDTVTVRIIKVDVLRNQIDLEVVADMLEPLTDASVSDED